MRTCLSQSQWLPCLTALANASSMASLRAKRSRSVNAYRWHCERMVSSTSSNRLRSLGISIRHQNPREAEDTPIERCVVVVFSSRIRPIKTPVLNLAQVITNPCDSRASIPSCVTHSTNLTAPATHREKLAPSGCYVTPCLFCGSKLSFASFIVG